jgi:hypothetical protein
MADLRNALAREEARHGHGDTMVARWKGEKEIKNAKGFIMQIYKR